MDDKRVMVSPLPIDPVLPALVEAVLRDGHAVLEAPPGAGKTTRVPPALLDHIPGRILMLEPRRLAARAAAERMAHERGDALGATVGYRVRGDAKVSNATRIEVVTEGILTRMIQSDPELPGVGALIFDEFHERSLNADLGLALALDVRDTLRPDLALIIMSATLDGAAVARMIGDAPLITAEGRAFPVETRWRDTPLPAGVRIEDAVAQTVRQALDETTGGILVFLPGEGEIRRTQSALKGVDAEVLPLFSAMSLAEQRRAVRPFTSGRKVVLATSIAETSLTIEDIRVVIDAGLARRSRFDPGSGMARLVTEKVTRAEADQRRGRAGRVAEGVCYRLWTKGQEGALAAYPAAEIEAGDLAGLALELALWGTGDVGDMRFLSRPMDGALASARTLLRDLGALDTDGRITDHGRAVGTVPLHPRLAHMLTQAGPSAATVAALLDERDPLRGSPVDLTLRLEALNGPRKDPALNRIRQSAQRLEKIAPRRSRDLSLPQMVALAYPDRVGLRRSGDAPRWLLSGGKGAKLSAEDPLAGARLIVVSDTDGHSREASIRQALAISEGELRDVMPDRITETTVCAWSARDKRVLTLKQERFGAIVLSEQRWRDAAVEDIARAMLDGVRLLGFSMSDAVERFRARVALAREVDPDLPDLTDVALMDTLEDWLLPHLSGVRSAADWAAFDVLPALRASLNWSQQQTVDRIAPATFRTPLGREVPVDYATEPPTIEVRLQELFGETTHPTVAGRALRLSLLSPARRPVQVTTDLPRFWSTSYADVRKDMRGRYPKHPWPEDPTQVPPTLRAKPRGT